MSLEGDPWYFVCKLHVNLFCMLFLTNKINGKNEGGRFCVTCGAVGRASGAEPLILLVKNWSKNILHTLLHTNRCPACTHDLIITYDLFNTCDRILLRMTEIFFYHT